MIDEERKQTAVFDDTPTGRILSQGQLEDLRRFYIELRSLNDEQQDLLAAFINWIFDDD